MKKQLQTKLDKWINLARMKQKQQASKPNLSNFDLDYFASVVADKVVARLLTLNYQIAPEEKTIEFNIKMSKRITTTKTPKFTPIQKELLNELKQNEFFKKRKILVEGG